MTKAKPKTGPTVPEDYLSIRAIARKLGRSQDTITRALASKGVEPFIQTRMSYPPLPPEDHEALRAVLRRCREFGAGSEYSRAIGETARKAIARANAQGPRHPIVPLLKRTLIACAA